MSRCTECNEYDKAKHYCPKWCDVIKGTIDDVRADERRKFAEWLLENGRIWNGYHMEYTDDEIMTDIFEDYERSKNEQKQ